MKRREFLTGIAATVGATALPLPTLAKAATHTTAKVLPFHYGWACVFARTNNGITATDIQRVFNVSQSEASSLMDRMLTRGVLRPPGLDGRSHATRTWEPRIQKTASPNLNKSTEHNARSKRGTRAIAKFRQFIANMKTEPDVTRAA
ncbi:hypothetical protein L0664_09850 [Octadecabacter sp. G9-8]|uniref:MarR family transcriptional regulator n=1 Tax=Octadecabacter dasysiphoniae TaxID=2909341 RepID=A0ABS9CYX2_9RHOB|nr:helix-turn-helix domain-containing protein [Octadecabacter dasysiphoniae]MCF2871366.1 hypothetical protein [Octadecabacter dasysiphoniae]